MADQESFDPLIDEMDRMATTIASGADLDPKYVPVAHIAHGWFTRTYRTTMAMLTLQEVGFAGECAPLARSVVEHVAALRWLVDDGAAILDPLKRGHGEGTAKLKASWAESEEEADLSHFDAVMESVKGADNKRDYLLHVWSVLSHYGTPTERTEYRKQVMQSHPTYQSAAMYYDIEADLVLDASREDGDYRHFAAVFLYKAMLEFAQVFRSNPWAEFLSEMRPRLLAAQAQDV